MEYVFWSWPLTTHRLRWASLVLLGALMGCSPRQAGELDASRQALPPIPHSASLADAWGGAKSAWVESALSPALLLHSTAREVRFFVPEAGRSNTVPRYLAFGANGPKLLTNGMPANVSKMQERWILVWFGGCAGWEKSDCPLGIFLQNPLQEMEFDARGLTLRFSGGAGDVTVMPLYGARSLPISPEDLAALPINREERRKLPRVWEWTKSVPRDPLTRLRYWSSVLAKFPYHAWGCWGNDPLKPEILRFYSGFEQHPVPVAWAISPLVVSPIPSAVAQLARQTPPPIAVSQTVFDMDWPRLGAPLFTVPEFENYSIEPGKGSKGVTEFKAAVSSVLHLGDRIQGESNLHAEGWREWTFDPRFGSDASSTVLVFDPASSQLEWGHTNQTRLVRKSLGEVWFDGARQESWEPTLLNPNARLLRAGSSK